MALSSKIKISPLDEYFTFIDNEDQLENEERKLRSKRMKTEKSRKKFVKKKTTQLFLELPKKEDVFKIKNILNEIGGLTEVTRYSIYSNALDYCQGKYEEVNSFLKNNNYKKEYNFYYHFNTWNVLKIETGEKKEKRIYLRFYSDDAQICAELEVTNYFIEYLENNYFYKVSEDIDKFGFFNDRQHYIECVLIDKDSLIITNGNGIEIKDRIHFKDLEEKVLLKNNKKLRDKHDIMREILLEKMKRQKESNLKSEKQEIKNTNVYVMLNPLNNKYKIGRSDWPARRLRELRSIEPAIELLFHYPANGSDEIYLHIKYNDKRLHNEWFSLNEQDLIEIKEYLEGIQNAKA